FLATSTTSIYTLSLHDALPILVHQVVFRHKRYIVEVSETTDVAGDFITWARFQLKFNRKLRDDFGTLLHERSSQNELDNKYGFIDRKSTRLNSSHVSISYAVFC